jgi:hypothetical protein
MNLRSRSVRILVLLVVLAVTGTLAYALSNARKGYEPRQPILFRHTRMAGAPVWQANDKGEQVNVGGFSIPCVYCHTMPYKGRHSTVPSTAVCMNCHTSVGLNREWVLKMKDYWDRGEPIPWVKVYDLPLADDQGKPMVVCQNCHGKVEEMEIVSVDHPFNMQWCLDCHRKPEMKTSTDCVVCHR